MQQFISLLPYYVAQVSGQAGKELSEQARPQAVKDFSDLDARLAIGPPKVVHCGYVTRTRFRIEMTSIGQRCLRKNNGVMLLLHAGENFADYVTNLWSIEPSSTLLEHIVHPP